jgi:UDP-2-acetamido-2,6-beta-L-arabino-hexul-4-ose reductase
VKNILLVGSSGFIGFNLAKKISEKHFITHLNRNSLEDFLKISHTYDVVIYCAGANRGTEKYLKEGNEVLLKKVLEVVNFKKIIFLSSSLIHTSLGKHKDYIRSKLECENILNGLQDRQVIILRLPNVFGIWSLPNYNCFLHTLAYKISRNLKYEIHNNSEELEFLYIDDLIKSINKNLSGESSQIEYQTTKTRLLDLESKIKKIRDGLVSNDLSCIQSSFDSQLLVTYLYHSPAVVSQCKNIFKDQRGEFIELMKINSTQISIIICNPGCVRGNHFHYNKIEHFLVLEGDVKFVEINVRNSDKEVTFVTAEPLNWITTRPGINHTIVNDGLEAAKILCIANEIFDKENPDTFTIL